MSKRINVICILIICCASLISFLGCEKIEIEDTQYTSENIEVPTTQESVLPNETNSQIQSVEEKIFIMRGLSFLLTTLQKKTQ